MGALKPGLGRQASRQGDIMDPSSQRADDATNHTLSFPAHQAASAIPEPRRLWHIPVQLADCDPAPPRVSIRACDDRSIAPGDERLFHLGQRGAVPPHGRPPTGERRVRPIKHLLDAAPAVHAAPGCGWHVAGLRRWPRCVPGSRSRDRRTMVALSRYYLPLSATRWCNGSRRRAGNRHERFHFGSTAHGA